MEGERLKWVVKGKGTENGRGRSRDRGCNGYEGRMVRGSLGREGNGGGGGMRYRVVKNVQGNGRMKKYNKNYMVT